MNYLTACIDKALRLVPPVPEGLPRVTPPEGESICGLWVSGGVRPSLTCAPTLVSELSFSSQVTVQIRLWQRAGRRRTSSVLFHMSLNAGWRISQAAMLLTICKHLNLSRPVLEIVLVNREWGRTRLYFGMLTLLLVSLCPKFGWPYQS